MIQIIIVFAMLLINLGQFVINVLKDTIINELLLNLC